MSSETITRHDDPANIKWAPLPPASRTSRFDEFAEALTQSTLQHLEANPGADIPWALYREGGAGYLNLSPVQRAAHPHLRVENRKGDGGLVDTYMAYDPSYVAPAPRQRNVTQVAGTTPETVEDGAELGHVEDPTV